MRSRLECVLHHLHERGSSWGLALKIARGRTETDLRGGFYPLKGYRELGGIRGHMDGGLALRASVEQGHG